MADIDKILKLIDDGLLEHPTQRDVAPWYVSDSPYSSALFVGGPADQEVFPMSFFPDTFLIPVSTPLTRIVECSTAAIPSRFTAVYQRVCGHRYPTYHFSEITNA